MSLLANITLLVYFMQFYTKFEVLLSYCEVANN